MALSNCSFRTDRLVVDHWSQLLRGESAEVLRDRFVMSLLTDAATRDLPAGWQGGYNMERAASWFAERERESTVLLVANGSDGHPVGLLILSESGDSPDTSDIRLGYVIAESAWGIGLATELVAGIADWCRADGTVRSLVGGVADRNIASARVLLRNGFIARPSDIDRPVGEVDYALALTT